MCTERGVWVREHYHTKQRGLTWMLQDGINGAMLMQERENSTIQVVAQPSSFNKLDPFLSIVPIASSIVCAGY